MVFYVHVFPISKKQVAILTYLAYKVGTKKLRLSNKGSPCLIFKVDLFMSKMKLIIMQQRSHNQGKGMA